MERKEVILKDESVVHGHKIIIGNKRKAIFFVDNNGVKHQFPDFYTFSKLGFDLGDLKKLDDDRVDTFPAGEPIKTLPAPPPFRPDDFMYHELCHDNYRKIVDDLSVVANMGDFDRHINVLRRIRAKKSIDILALGGSITAGGYYSEFVRLLEVEHHYNVTIHNHGHGATGIPYTLYCVDFERYSPDLILVDFAVNDYGHPKLMDGLLRRLLMFKSEPIIALVNLWVAPSCPTVRYLTHSFYYHLPLINLCPAANLCYGRRLPKYITEEYSLTDGVHPWGVNGVPFIGKVLFAWWARYEDILIKEELTAIMDPQPADSPKKTYLKPLYYDKPIGACTRCDALVDDADSKLSPVEVPIGFKVATRVKTGFGGFDGNTSVKSFKRSWQAETPGSTIVFKFYGSSVAVAMWQRRDGMGILYATVDGDEQNVAKASGFFKGYPWAMDRNNTGRSEIISLFEGLEDKEHIIKFKVSNEHANKWVRGHTAQIFALLSASSNPNCKKVMLA
jgi:hypothetical protein